jgi:lipopolysaccharide biosynthesis glycosyltransferase
MSGPQHISAIPKRLDASIPVVLSSDDRYSPYLAVTIQSLVHHSDPAKLYAIHILDGGISDENRALIDLVAADRPNISIQYIDIEQFMEREQASAFRVPEHSHFSKACYYRFFIPQVFADFEKVIYLDADLILLEDLALLYSLDLGGKSVGACRDYAVMIMARTYQDHQNYYVDTLRLKNPESYFNTGVLVCNIPKMLAEDFTAKCIHRLREIGNPLFVEQCVMNSVLEGDTLVLDCKWNFMTNTLLFDKPMMRALSPAEYGDVMTSYKNPFVIHYASGDKPWRYKTSGSELAQHWWHYAAMSSFKDRIYQNLHQEIEASNPSRYGDATKVKSIHTNKIRIFGITILSLSKSRNQLKIRLFGFFPILFLQTS